MFYVNNLVKCNDDLMFKKATNKECHTTMNLILNLKSLVTTLPSLLKIIIKIKCCHTKHNIVCSVPLFGMYISMNNLNHRNIKTDNEYGSVEINESNLCQNE